MILAPNNKLLRDFGLGLGVIVAVLFGLLIPWWIEKAWPYWPWIVLLVSASVAISYPKLLYPVYWVFSLVGLVLNKVVNTVVLSILYILILMPIGWIRKALGKNALGIGFERKTKSYLSPAKRREASHMEKPY